MNNNSSIMEKYFPLILHFLIYSVYSMGLDVHAYCYRSSGYRKVGICRA